MKVNFKKVLIELLSVMLLAGGTACYAGFRYTEPFTISLEPSGPLQKGAPITMYLEYRLDSKLVYLAADTGSYSVIFLNPRDHGDTLSIATYPVRYDSTFLHSATFQVILPDADTNFCVVKVVCGVIYQRDYNYFIATGEKVEFLPNFHLPPPLEYQSKVSDPKYYHRNIDRDTLTREQLQMELDVAIDLRNKKRLRIVEETLGPLPDSCKVPGYDGHYIIRITLEQAYKLEDKGIDLEEVRGNMEIQKSSDQPESKGQNDSTKDQSNNSLSPNGLSLDSVVGMTPEGKLLTDATITFYIHIKNTDYTPRFGIQNGFRIWSPDGASWNSLTADTVNLEGCSWGEMFDFGFFIKYFSVDGIGADTAGFGGMAFNAGMPSTFDETSYAITIGPIDDVMDGKTICLDSAFFPPAGDWIWVDINGDVSIPPWDGPYCFAIEKASTINYSGHLYYLDPVPPDINQMPMRRVKIEMWDDDGYLLPHDSLDADTTDDMGYFELGPVENNDQWGRLDIYFKIYA